MTPIDSAREVFREKCADAYLKRLRLSMQQFPVATIGFSSGKGGNPLPFLIEPGTCLAILCTTFPTLSISTRHRRKNLPGNP
jgi:hypothetical protein